MENLVHNIFTNEAVAALLPYVKEFLRLITWVPIVILLIRWVRLLYAPKTVDEPFAILSLKNGNTRYEINGYETSVGRMKNSDIVLNFPFISRNHAVICYRKNKWYVFDTGSSGGVFVNGRKIKKGKEIITGDTVAFADLEFVFGASYDMDDSRDIYSSKKAEKDRLKKLTEKAKKRKITPSMLFSSVMAFQVICLIRLCLCEHFWAEPTAVLSVLAFMLIETVYYVILRKVSGGGVLETTAFFLSGVGLFALAGATPEAVLWQLVAFVIGLLFFVVFNLFLSDLDRVMKFKPYIVALAVILLVINLALGKVIGGSQNWIRLGALSLQPSEFVKIAFILVGSTTLERMQSSNHLTWFMVFFAVCMASLAWMGDIGTAAVFFATFLVLCFLRNGRFGTAILMCGGAAAAGSALIIAKPYIARRFSVWGHVWNDPNGLGYQQTRTLIAIASGGVLGLGPGNGVLKNVVAANNDLIFGLVSEEWGLLAASLVLLVYFGWVVLAIRGASGAKSSFYAIAAVSAACLLLFQAGLNVFGVTDIIPLTGITLPFVSRGGSSMMASWGLLSFLNFVPRLGEDQ